MAVVLCGAGIAVVATGVSAAVRGEAYAADLTQAADHAELILARLECGELPLEEAEGDFTDDGAPDIKWKVALDTTDVENLVRVTVTVFWTTHGIERDLWVERWFFVDPEQGEQ